jgi:hypothetical protein
MPSRSGADLAGGPESTARPLLEWALLGQTGGADPETAEPAVLDSRVLAYDFGRKAEAAGGPASAPVADRDQEAATVSLSFLAPEGLTDAPVPLPVPGPVAAPRAIVPKETARPAAVWMGDEHDAWMPVLAAIATYAATRPRRAKSEEGRRR